MLPPFVFEVMKEFSLQTVFLDKPPLSVLYYGMFELEEHYDKA